MANDSDEREITPFKLINRGEDTVDENGEVKFADFSPRVLPSDAPDPVEITSPKAASAPGPAPSSGSQETTGQTQSGDPAPEPVEPDGTSVNPSGNGSPASSSAPKTG